MTDIDINYGKEWPDLFDSIVKKLLTSENNTVQLPKPFSKYTVTTGFDVYSVFNKLIVIGKQELEFSWDSLPEVTREMLELVTGNEGNIPESALTFRDDNYLNNPEFSAERCERLINMVFSPDYARKILTSEGGLSTYIDKKSTAGSGKIKGPYSRKSPAIRFEEEVRDYTIVLMIIPDDYSMKLNFRRKEKFFPENPLSAFYRYYYTPARYSKDELIHDLRFFEHLGYDTFPQNQHNVNTFETVFNYGSQNIDYIQLAIKSGDSQMKFIRNLFPYLILFGGPDVEGNSLLQPEDEMIEEQLPSEDKTLRFYNVFRTFCAPYYDIVIKAGLKQMNIDDFDFVFSDLNAAVFPYAKDMPVLNKAQFHPLVYEAGK